MDDFLDENAGPFGLDPVVNSGIILLDLPLEVTTSFRKGTANGPSIVFAASHQVDTFLEGVSHPWDMKVSWDKSLRASISQSNEKLGVDHDQLKTLLLAETTDVSAQLSKLDSSLDSVKEQLYQYATNRASDHILIGGIGGEHTLTEPLVRAALDKHQGIGILQIDAHLDLRNHYMDLRNSHASVMRRVLELTGVEKIVNVGARDFCEEEWELVQINRKLAAFSSKHIAKNLFTGMTWHNQVQDILNQLPSKVYLTLDIDGLDATLCPSTGTPVPGGLTFEMVNYLIEQLVISGRKIIGFDLVEVAGNEESIDAIIAAQLLYRTLAYASVSNGLLKRSVTS